MWPVKILKQKQNSHQKLKLKQHHQIQEVSKSTLKPPVQSDILLQPDKINLLSVS